MNPQDILRALSLVTAGVFYAVAAIQITRNKVKTWTESFFALAFVFGGTYAVSDFFYASSSSPEMAMLDSKVSFSLFTLTVMFLFLFSQVFFGRLKKVYLLHVATALVVIGMICTVMITYAHRTPWGWDTEYDGPLFAVWMVFLLVYMTATIWNLYSAYVIAPIQDKSLRRKAGAAILGLVFWVAAGATTNTLLAVFDLGETHTYSALMIIPGLATLALVSPVSWRSLMDSTRRWSRGRYAIDAAYLMCDDGTLIGSKFAHPPNGPDSDLFLATLDTIQNFMRVSFPAAVGKWLKVIEQGDVRIVIERGALASLVLVIKGEEDEFLRRQMKETLGAYETLNGDVLAKWKGVARDATGTQRFLDLFFARETFF